MFWGDGLGLGDFGLGGDGRCGLHVVFWGDGLGLGDFGFGGDGRCGLHVVFWGDNGRIFGGGRRHKGVYIDAWGFLGRCALGFFDHRADFVERLHGGKDVVFGRIVGCEAVVLRQQYVFRGRLSLSVLGRHGQASPHHPHHDQRLE